MLKTDLYLKKINIILFIAIGIMLFGCQNAYSEEISIPEITLIAEGVNQGFEGMIAIGEVIRNRVKSNRWPNNPEEVAHQKWQFSCWNNPQKAYKFAYDHREYWTKAEKAWEVSERSNITGGADHYHADYVKPDWNWDLLEHTVTIKKHMFYKYKEIR